MSLRRAALRLHGLCPADQECILAELAPAEQDALRTSLRELESLGFPKDACWQAEAGPQAPGKVQGGLAGGALENAQPAAMHAILRGEPESLIAALLAERNWPWKEGYFDRLEAGHRARLQMLASTAQPFAPQLREAVHEALERTLQTLPVEAAPPAVQASPRSRWSAWIR
jgi:hypothetical protein